MLTIKVLGAGCANCKQVEKVTHNVVEEMALEAEVIKITDYTEIMTYDILSTPGLWSTRRLSAPDASLLKRK